MSFKGCRLVAAAFVLIAAGPALAADLVLRAPQGPYVEALINGVPLRLKVEYALLPDITLNPEAARRAGLGAGDSGWTMDIGPVKLRGRRSEDLPVTLAGLATRTTVRWLDAPAAADDADGLVSVSALPFDSVTIERRAAAAGERDLVLEARVHDNHGLMVPVEVGERRVAVRLSFFQPRTTAPAAAVAILSKRHGGSLEGTKSVEGIAHGVERPVRRFRLIRPLQVGELTIASLMARTSDFRGDHKLVLPRPVAAPGEILVSGRKHSQDALYRITLGLDVLGRCSAATYSRLLRQIRLRCAEE